MTRTNEIILKLSAIAANYAIDFASEGNLDRARVHMRTLLDTIEQLVEHIDELEQRERRAITAETGD